MPNSSTSAAHVDSGADRDLWFDWYVDRLRLGGVSERYLGSKKRGVYLVAVLAWLVPAVGFPAVQFLRDGTFPIGRTPGLSIALVGVLFGLFAARWLREHYHSVVSDLPAAAEPFPWVHWWPATAAVERLRSSSLADDVPTAPVPTWVRRSALVLALGLHGLWFVVDPNPMAQFTAVYGRPMALVFFLVFVPAVYSVLGAELLSLYVGIHFLLPLRIIAGDRLDFSDELQFGKLRPVGRLVRNSAATMLLLLAVFTVAEAIGVQTSPVDPFSRILLFGGIVFGALSFCLPVFVLHEFMHGMKAAKLAQLRDRGSGPAVLLEPPPSTAADLNRYTHEYIRLDRVQSMREWPIDFGIVLEFVMVLLLPYLAELSASYVFEELLH